MFELTVTLTDLSQVGAVRHQVAPYLDASIRDDALLVLDEQLTDIIEDAKGCSHKATIFVYKKGLVIASVCYCQYFTALTNVLKLANNDSARIAALPIDAHLGLGWFMTKAFGDPVLESGRLTVTFPKAMQEAPV